MATTDTPVASGTSPVDIAKLVVAAAFVVAGIVGYYWLADSALILRVLCVIGGVLAGGAIAWLTAPGREFTVFAAEAVTEVKKVVWPTRKETIQTTAAVFAFVIVMAVFLWLSDKTLEWVLYEWILGWKKS
jgi:preprotein translocase subunit SecE